METLLRIILLRGKGRGATPAWLAALALAIVGALSYAADHRTYSPSTSKLQQHLGEHAAAFEDRRIFVQRATKGLDTNDAPGDADGVLPSAVSARRFLASTDDVVNTVFFGFNRRLTSSAHPRAPPL